MPHTPDEPKMGGIKKGQYHVAWTGGEPKPDWEDGLVELNPKHIGQFQRRYEDGKAAIFGYKPTPTAAKQTQQHSRDVAIQVRM